MKDAMKTMIVNAVRLIEEHGWCQGETMNSKGNMCVAGGMSAAAHGTGKLKAAVLGVKQFHNDKVFTKTMEYLDERLGKSVPAFNDTPGRKWETIKAILLEAADYLDEIPEPVKVVKHPITTGFAKHLYEHQKAINSEMHNKMVQMMEGLLPSGGTIGQPKYKTATEIAHGS